VKDQELPIEATNVDALDTMEHLPIHAADKCRWDLFSLGEVMLRFDLAEGRIVGARSFASGRAAANTTWSASLLQHAHYHRHRARR
jgi:hypothetical protein